MRCLATIIALLIFHDCLPQNLVVNGDFEEENICTEYKVNCAPEAWIANKDGFSTYFKDAFGAYSGTHFVGLEIGHTSKIFQRTFSRTRLLCGLRRDHTYRLNFYVRSGIDVLDSMGVLFTSFDFLFGKKKLQNLAPSLFFQSDEGKFRKDTAWQKVTLLYRATGDEAFLSFAYFGKRDITAPASENREGHFFVYLDDVVVTPVDPHEVLCTQAATNAADILAQDERHEYLRSSIRQNNDNPPTVVVPPTMLLRVDTLVLPDMLFASGKADLQPGSAVVIENFCKGLTGRSIDSIVVEGHTDNKGTITANRTLSQARATHVKEMLTRQLKRQNPIIIVRGWADAKPVATNGSAAGRQRNRRVELFVYTHE